MPTTKYGGFWNRFLAFFIDAIIISIGYIIIFRELDFILRGFKIEYSVVVDVLMFLSNWLYFAIMESSAKQATLGKMVMKLVVTDKKDNRLTFARATVRYFAKWLSFIILMIGYIIAAFTEKEQALHDMIAGTIVYQKQPLKAGRIIVGLLVSLIGLVFVISNLLPSFLSSARIVKQSEAKLYIASVNKGQQAYYAEREEFSDKIYDLGLGIKLETTNYSYDISKVRYRYVISTATAKKQPYRYFDKKYRSFVYFNQQLKSYSGIVYVADDNTTKSMICQTDKPSLIAPDDFESVDKCPSGSSDIRAHL